jgi:transcription antitermination factor NusG
MSDYWYALHVKPRFEKYVTSLLTQKGYQTLMPIYVSRRKWSDRVKTLSLPLFPGYIFCRFNVDARLPILVTPGVITVVGMGRVPAPVDESEIAAIRRVMDSQVHTEPSEYLTAGSKVRVDSGALQGLEGLIVRVKDTDRLIVSVRLLMRSVAVDIDRVSVKPLLETSPQALPAAEVLPVVRRSR